MFLSAHSYSSNKNKIFHFNNFLLYYDGCHNSGIIAWNIYTSSSFIHAFSHSISWTKSNLIRWRSFGLHSINAEIQNLKVEINNIESLEASSPDLGFKRGSDPSAIDTMLSYVRMLFLAQRAKMQWLNKGDHITSYFHKSTKIRQHRNKIWAIIDNGSNIFIDQIDIENCFLNFYKIYSLRPLLSILTIWFMPWLMDLPHQLERIRMFITPLDPCLMAKVQD